MQCVRKQIPQTFRNIKTEQNRSRHVALAAAGSAVTAAGLGSVAADACRQAGGIAFVGRNRGSEFGFIGPSTNVNWVF